MKLKSYILFILLIISGIFYYNLTSKVIYETQEVFVIRVIDGDTFEIENNLKARLKGINTPEKSQLNYQEAKDFLKNLIENQTIEIDIYEKDKYGRLLVYAYKNNQLINQKIIEKGLAHLYYYEKDENYNKLKQAELEARNQNLGIWKKSSDSECLEILKLKFKETTRCNNQEQIILQNNCNKKIDFVLKDDATHIYEETIQPQSILTKNFSCIWNNDGDSLYAWDEQGLLMFKRY